MKAIALRLLFAVMLALAVPLSAEAGGKHGWGGGHYKHHYGSGYRHHGHRGYDSGDLVVAFGLGAALGLFSGWATAPAAPGYRPYYAPRRVITCVDDEVWRYLPDGRIQTGVRRTCY